MYYFFPGSHMRKWWPQKIKYPAQSRIVNGSQNPNSSTTIPSCSQGRYTREYVGAKKKKKMYETWSQTLENSRVNTEQYFHFGQLT